MFPQHDIFTNQAQNYNLSRTPIKGSMVAVFVAGLLLTPEIDYQIKGNALSITFLVGFNQVVQVFYLSLFG